MATVLAVVLLLGTDEWQDFKQLAKDRDPDERCKAVELIRKHRNLAMVQALLPLLGDAHPRVRARATTAVAGVTEPDGIAFLIKAGLRHVQPLVRRYACRSLGLLGDKDAVAPVIDALGDPDPLVRAEAASTLALLGDRASADPLAAAFVKDRAWETRAACFDALSRIDPLRAEALLAQAIADKAPQVRIEALRHGGLPAILALAGDPDWRVRIQAFESALLLRHRDCIEPLVAGFAREKGRLRSDCLRALEKLTGKDIGTDPKAWRAWWDAVRDSFDVPAKVGALSGAGVATRAEFFNIPILSNRVSFVLDLSGSMREEAPDGQTKLDVARRAMAKAIASFTSDVFFDIILLGCERDGTFRREQKVWKSRLTPATDAGKRDAIRFLNAQEARGWTNIWDGLEYAMEDDEVDTLFLYSDGGASNGVWTQTAEILAQLDELNRYRKVMIHTVETVGTKPNTADNTRLLKEIAAHTGGIYRLGDDK